MPNRSPAASLSPDAHPADDAPRDHAGDLHDRHPGVVALQTDRAALVGLRARVVGGHEAARRVRVAVTTPSIGRAVDVDVERRQEDRDPHRRAHERIDARRRSTVTRPSAGDSTPPATDRDRALGIAEEPDRGQRRPPRTAAPAAGGRAARARARSTPGTAMNGHPSRGDRKLRSPSHSRGGLIQDIMARRRLPTSSIW